MMVLGQPHSLQPYSGSLLQKLGTNNRQKTLSNANVLGLVRLVQLLGARHL